MLKQEANVLRRLAAADREHQKERGGALVLRCLKYACAWVLCAFAADVLLHLDASWRVRLLFATLGGTILVIGIGWYIGFIRRNRLEHTARLLETRQPSLGSRLINLLQLRKHVEDPSLAPLTRDLSRQAVEEYATGLSGTPLERLAWGGELRREFKRTVWAGAGFAAICVLFFRITAVEIARFVDPYGDHPPYSFTHLEIVEPGTGGTNVIYGRGVIVKVKAAGHQPKEVFLSAFQPDHPEKMVTLPMFDKGKVGYHQLVDNIRTELLLFAHTKDKSSRSKQTRIGVVLTPQLEKAFVRITPPAYTGLKPAENPYSMKPLQALAGSEVRFRLQSNRPLREGTIEVSTGGRTAERVLMKPLAENEVSGTLVATDSCRLGFTLVDADGLPSQEPWEGSLTVTHDLPPEVRIAQPEHDALVAIDFKLQAQIEASDDYGLQSIRLHCGVNGVYPDPKVKTYDTPVRDAREVVDLNFAQIGAQPGDILSLFAEAIDTAPDPHLARSQTVRLKVISVEEYNEMLREQTDIAETEARYAELLEDFRELLENQKQLGEASSKLAEQLAKANPKDQEDLVRQFDDLLAKQNELNQQLNRHAERMDQFVRENPLYDIEKELQKFLQRQAGEIRQSTATNDAAAKDLAQQSSPPSGGRQLTPELATDFKKASDDQLARLGGVRDEADKQITKTLRDMRLMQELLKDFNQFEALYRVQQELAAQSQAYNRPGMLEREDQLALKDLAASEKQVGDLLERLEQKLREDAKAAEALFPKAARSGRDLADSMNELRLQPLARQATDQMLAANGERSFRLAERLRGEMEKLFSDCQGGNCPSSGELDSYLRLQRQLNGGNSFAQMSRSRNFGQVSGQGLGQQGGEGEMGSSGYAVMGPANLNLLGNELAAGSRTASRLSDRLSKARFAQEGGAARAASDKPDVLKGLNPVNRHSGAVSSEMVMEEYSDLVDSYFKAITTKKEK